MRETQRELQALGFGQVNAAQVPEDGEDLVGGALVGIAEAFATRLNPLWMLVAGGILGFAGVV